MNLFDIIILLIIGGCCWRGWRKGLSKMLFQLIGALLGLGVAMLWYRPFSIFLDTKIAFSKVVGIVVESLPGIAPIWGFLFGSGGTLGLGLGDQGVLARFVGSHGHVVSQVLSEQLDQEQLPIDTANAILSWGVTEAISFILVFFVVYFMTLFSVKVIRHFTGPLFDSETDRRGGIVMGFLFGVVSAALFLIVLSPLQVPLALFFKEGDATWVSNMVQGSTLAHILLKGMQAFNLVLPGGWLNPLF